MPETDPGTSLLVEGRNCWRKLDAERITFLVDGEEYFSAVHESIGRAQRSVQIAGWDIDSRVALLRGDPSAVERSRLVHLIENRVEENPELHVHILVWDFAMVFALEREILPVFRFDWRSSGRLNFHLDGEHPLGASHHQKIVVIDDRIAFVGGFDLTKARWDTRAHLAEDDRRVTPHGELYGPFHDIQMLVDGEAASALGELFRKRWYGATEELLSPVGPVDHDPWPQRVKPDVTNVQVAVARTEPHFRDNPEVREIEALYIDGIHHAKSMLYIENQYFTSSRIEAALSERLQEEGGPEVILVLPYSSSGWLEESTMDTARAAVLERLRKSDRFGRLGVYFPYIPGVHLDDFTMHAKVLIADDDFVRVGSSNTSNRSLGTDTECDLAFEALGDTRVSDAIERFRTGLLAEHLGLDRETVRTATTEKGSVRGAIEALRGSERSLRPLEARLPDWVASLAPYSNPADPERPVDPDTLVDEFIPPQVRETGRSGILHFGVVLVALALLTTGWATETVAQWSTLHAFSAAQSFNRLGLVPLLVVTAVFIAGAAVRLPVTLLTGLIALVFDFRLAVLYSAVGCSLNAVLGYSIGRRLGREMIRRLAGRTLNRVSSLVSQGGVATIAKIRLIPTIPFTVANLVMGATSVDFISFSVGSLIGLLPGILAITLFTDRLKAFILDPALLDLAVLAAVTALMLLASVWARKSLYSQRGTRSAA